MMRRNERDHLCPSEGGALPLRISGGFLPGVEQMNFPFGNPDFESISTMINDAKSASINLRNAKPTNSRSSASSVDFFK
jgi:hypothetical protein